MAVWYARQMGLPVANIICGCYQNSSVWELLHLGEAHTDELPEELERLVFGTLGIEEVKRYCGQTGTYRLLTADLERLRKGLFAAVVSQERVDAARALRDKYLEVEEELHEVLDVWRQMLGYHE